MNKFIDISQIEMPAGIPKTDFNKRTGTYEISCSLFSACNLNCKFCFQDHSDYNVDTEKIMAMPERIMKTIKQEMIDYGVDQKIFIRIWGGELFFDKLPDCVFTTYYNFYAELKSRLNKAFSECSIEVHWASNGVFEKHERVEKLLRDTDGLIALSYDAVDRFRDDVEKDIWLNTLKYFHERELLSAVSITLTKPMIMACLAGDKYFNQIPSDVTIDVNDYIGNPNYEKYRITDEEVYSFYEWCLKNHVFNAAPIMCSIDNYLNGETERYCYCKCSNLFYADGGNTKNCVDKYSGLPAKCFYGEYADQITEDNCTEVKNYLGLSKRGCLTCDYYNYCWMTCWTSVIFEGYETTVCPFQQLFQYLKDNPNTVNQFLKWRSTNGN